MIKFIKSRFWPWTELSRLQLALEQSQARYNDAFKNGYAHCERLAAEAEWLSKKDRPCF